MKKRLLQSLVVVLVVFNVVVGVRVYQAVGAPKAFAIHAYGELKPCPVSCHIKASLEKYLGQAQQSLEAKLDKITLADIIADIRKR